MTALRTAVTLAWIFSSAGVMLAFGVSGSPGLSHTLPQYCCNSISCWWISTPAMTVARSAWPCTGVYVQVSRRICGALEAGGASASNPNSSRNSSTVPNCTRISSPRVGYCPCRVPPSPAGGHTGLGSGTVWYAPTDGSMVSTSCSSRNALHQQPWPDTRAGRALTHLHASLVLPSTQASTVLAAMGSAFKEQLRQFLWLNPTACFQLRGWIGVHKEGIPPGPEFLLRLLLCLKRSEERR